VLHSIKKTLVFEELTDEYHKEIFRKLDIEVILPLIVGDEDIGLLILGPKLSGDIYMDRDIEFLEIFAPQVAIALKNADSYRQIQEFNQTLELKVIDRTHELEAAQAAELKLKDEFVFIATHDLATPVTAISGFSALIKARKDKLPEPVAKDLNAIDEASNRLKVLVNDLLQVARSDSGTIKVELTRINATEILDSAIREIGPLAGEKRVTVISKVSSKLMILADSVKLAEVFENLLSNGVKYNKSGGTLTISSRTSGGKIVIEFKDTGLKIENKASIKSSQRQPRCKPRADLFIVVGC
jgi:signal transduction histidine kinase